MLLREKILSEKSSSPEPGQLTPMCCLSWSLGSTGRLKSPDPEPEGSMKAVPPSDLEKQACS